MRIIIPSRGRPDAQITARILRAAEVPFVIARTVGDDTVYPAEYEQEWYEASGINDKRNQILARHPGKVMVIDDDITFHWCVEDTTFLATGAQIREMVRRMEFYLGHVAHAGVSGRFMIQSKKKPHIMNAKPKSVLGYNTDLFPDPWPRFTLKACSDIEFNLDLIARGKSCLLITEFCYTEADYMAPGGCSIWRTPDHIRAGMEALEKMYPKFIKLRSGEDLPGGTLMTVYMKNMAKHYACEPTSVPECPADWRPQ